MSWETYSADVLAELPKGSTVEKGRNHAVTVHIMCYDGNTVANIREDNFGSLKEPEEIQQWREEINAIRDQCQKMQNETAEACTTILGRLDKLAREITNTTERNGW